VKAALTDQILIRKGKIWTERPRIDPVVIFQASAPKIFNAVALIVVAVAGSAATVSAAPAASGGIASLAAALVDSAEAADSGAVGNN
jgi:hypothetical protein